MILSIGEILFDVFPDYRRIGGAPFNFAFHLKKLGYPVRFFSRIGVDTEGREIRAFLDANGFDPDDLQQDAFHPTGKVRVGFDTGGGPDFEILPGVAYDHLTWDRNIEKAVKGEPELIYFGSLIQRSAAGFQTVRKIMGEKPAKAKCLYDLNLRPDCYTSQIITASLRDADVVKMSGGELETLRNLLDGPADEERFIRELRKAYHIDMVAVTHGAMGSELFTPQGRHETRTPPLDRIRDSVGAGDAYTSILAIGYLKNRPPDMILAEASRFAGEICGIEGALPADERLYEDFKRPAGS